MAKKSYQKTRGEIRQNLTDPTWKERIERDQLKRLEEEDPELAEESRALRRELREGDAKAEKEAKGSILQQIKDALYEAAEPQEEREARERRLSRDEKVRRAKSLVSAPTTKRGTDVGKFAEEKRRYDDALSIIDKFDGEISPEALDALLDEREAWRNSNGGRPAKVTLNGEEVSLDEADRRLREDVALRTEKARLAADASTAAKYRELNNRGSAKSETEARAYAREYGFNITGEDGKELSGKALVDKVAGDMKGLASRDLWEEYKSAKRDELTAFYNDQVSKGESPASAQAMTLAKAGKFAFLLSTRRDMAEPVNPLRFAHRSGAMSVKDRNALAAKYALEIAAWYQNQEQIKKDQAAELSAKLDWRKQNYIDIDKAARARGYTNRQHARNRAQTEREMFLADYDRRNEAYNQKVAAKAEAKAKAEAEAKAEREYNESHPDEWLANRDADLAVQRQMKDERGFQKDERDFQIETFDDPPLQEELPDDYRDDSPSEEESETDRDGQRKKERKKERERKKGESSPKEAEELDGQLSQSLSESLSESISENLKLQDQYHKEELRRQKQEEDMEYDFYEVLDEEQSNALAAIEEEEAKAEVKAKALAAVKEEEAKAEAKAKAKAEAEAVKRDILDKRRRTV